jgi:3-oxoacyl-[acyl-carrier-protein] synthase III
VSGNTDFRFDDVAVVAVASCEAPVVITTSDIDERLRTYYKRTRVRPGLLRTLAGIRERRQWHEGTSFMDAAAMAGQRVLDESGVDPARIGLLLDTSVCRERLEPSSAVTVHHILGLQSTCLNYDISNACLGFLNGIHLAGVMIDYGQIEYALIVDAEGTREFYDHTIARLLGADASADDFIDHFSSLTLGSGAAGMILGRHSDNAGSHRVVRGLFRTASQHHELCVGSLEQMSTDSRALLRAGADLARIAWDDADKEDWLDMNRYILHQVSKVHTAAMVDVLGIDPDRVPMTFPDFGNLGPAAIPFTLASVSDTLEPGDRVLCMGIGSGLNASVVELLW